MSPPPVPVMVIGYVPATVVEATVKVAMELPEPGAAIEAGLKPTVTPVGAPEAVSAMDASNPPETEVAMVEDPLLPRTTESVVGESEMVKAGVCVVEPERAAIRPLFGDPHPVTRS